MTDDGQWEKIVERVQAATAALTRTESLPLSALTRQLLDAGDLDSLIDLEHDEECKELDGDEIVEHLASDVADILADTDELWINTDQRITHVPSLLADKTFTHRLVDEEVGSGILNATVDWSFVDFDLSAATAELPLATGGVIDIDARASRPAEVNQTFWRGPSGWLDGFTAGDLIGVRRIADAVEIVKCDAHDVTDEQASAFRAAFAAQGSRDGDEEIMFLTMEALSSSADAFAGVNPPMTDILDAAGLDVHDVWVGRKDTRWQSVGEKAEQRLTDGISAQFQLDTCCKSAFRRIRTAIDDGDDTTKLADAMTHGDAVLAAEAYERYRQDSIAGLLECGDLLDTTTVTGACVFAYFQGLDAEEHGDWAAAESAYRAAMSASEFTAPATKLIALTGDRGDAKATMALIQQFGDDTSELEILRAALVPAKVAGRNDPCPCGSGKKYKNCCQNKQEISVDTRGDWLRYRLVRFCLDFRGRRQVAALAAIAFGDNEMDEPTEDDLATLTSFAIHEGGGLARYIETRGTLFDDIDRALVEEWSAQPRALWEVTDVVAGTSVSVRNTTTSDHHVLRERTASRSIRTGDYLLARVVREGDAMVFHDFPISVSLARRQGVLDLLDSDPDATDLAAWYGSLFAMPTIVNTSGDTLEFYTADLEVTIEDEELIGVTLEEFFGPEGRPGHWVYLNDEQTVLGTIHHEGRLLTVEANSSSRLAELMAELEEIGLAFETKDVRSKSLTEAIAEHKDAPRKPSSVEMTPEIEAAVRQHLAKMEKNWVNEPVPALGGLTPRQALDDPTRREDLESVLRDMDNHWRANPGQGFGPGNIRHLLGLT